MNEYRASEGLILDSQGDDLLQLSQDLNLASFEVVRREYFAHLHEPSISFYGNKFSANAACLARFPEANYSEVLVNRSAKMLALHPCKEKERETFQWCSVKAGKRIPRQITCKLFFGMVFDMMGWDRNQRYKVLGRVVRTNNEYLIVFDLNAREAFQRPQKGDPKRAASRTAMLPDDWQGQFGLPYYDHKKYLHVNVVDGYAVYSLTDTPTQVQRGSLLMSQTTVEEAKRGELD